MTDSIQPAEIASIIGNMTRKEAKNEIYRIQRLLEKPLMTDKIRERLVDRMMELIGFLKQK